MPHVPLIQAFLHHLLTVDMLIIALGWAFALAGAGIAFACRLGHALPRTPGNFLRYCFPAIILRHPSCRLDLGFAVIAHFIKPLLFIPLMLGNGAMAVLVHDGLARLFGARPESPPSLVMWILLVAAGVALADLTGFLVHWAEHKAPPLWELHKVHHSATFLVPLTNRRIHPLQETIDVGAIAIALGIFVGGFSYFTALTVRDTALLGTDAYFLINVFSFYHLRHSHIPLGYGRLEGWLLSPLQHQVHHSVEREHWDRNFGLLLAFWDRAFGTLVYSDPGARFRLGLPPEHAADCDALWKLYLLAPVLMLRRLVEALPRRKQPEAGMLQADEAA